MPGKHFDLDTDINLGGENASDVTIASQKATKSYVDTKIAEIPGGSGASSLSQLNDTNISSPANGDIISYDLSESKWINKSINIPTDTNDLTNSAGFITQDAIPSNISEFNNDTGYLTEHQSLVGYTKSSELADVAFSGDYEDLENTPIIPNIPTNISAFTNDIGYLTEHQDISGKANLSELANVAISGNYNDLNGKPIIPVIPSDAEFTDTTYTGGTGLTISETVINHTNSIEAGTAGFSESSSGALVNIPFITYDAQGHITSVGNKIHTVNGFLTEHQDISGKANISEMADVAFSGDYQDLENTPTIPVVPSNVSEFNNDAGYLTQHQDISGKADESLVAHLAQSETFTGDKTFTGSVELGSNATTITQDISDNSTKVASTSFVKSQGYLTGISSSDIITALGYTPYNGSTNPSGFLTSLSEGTGISISGNTITNTGVTAIASGSTSGTILATVNGSETEVSVGGLGTAAFEASTAFASSSHNQASNTINALTGYSIGTESSAISSSDTLNVALGKLEYKVNNASGGGSILVEQLSG